MSLRNYSNFLVFEGMLESLPNTSPIMNQVAGDIIHPVLPVIEADCGTLVGEFSTLVPELEGSIEVSTGVAITEDRVLYLYSQNVHTAQIRSISSCTSIGGICAKCYSGSFPDLSVPAVGSLVTVSPRYILEVGMVQGTGYTTTLDILPNTFFNTAGSSDIIIVFLNGVIVPSNTYVIVGNSITFAIAPALNARVIIKKYGNSTSGLLGFFARSYSGGLFGIHELPTYRLPLRQELYESLILSDQVLDSMFRELSRYTLPSTSLDFYSRINSRLEKALFILYNYAIYASVQQ